MPRAGQHAGHHFQDRRHAGQQLHHRRVRHGHDRRPRGWHQYGGAHTLLLRNTGGDVGFTSSTTSVTAATAADATPFVNGDLITAKIKNSSTPFGTAIILYTVATGDTLQNIVAGINANASLSGINANLTYDVTTSTYNIRLSTTDGSEARFGPAGINTISLGANFEAGVGSRRMPPATTAHLPNSVYGLAGAQDNGLGFTSTSVTGTTSDNILTALAQTNAQVQIAFPAVAASALTNAGNFGSAGSTYLTVGGHVSASRPTPLQKKHPMKSPSALRCRRRWIMRYSTINSYFANNAVQDTAFELNQIKVTRSGNSLVFTGKTLATINSSEILVEVIQVERVFRFRYPNVGVPA